MHIPMIKVDEPACGEAQMMAPEWKCTRPTGHSGPHEVRSGADGFCYRVWGDTSYPWLLEERQLIGRPVP